MVDASTAADENVQQWQLNGHACQNWFIEYVEPNLIAGDVNLDETVNCVDLLAQKRCIINGGFASENARRCADVNNDKIVNSSDVKALCGFILRTNTYLVLGDAQDDELSYEPDNFSFSGNVYLVGDSTACEYSSTYTAGYNRYGWGMKLGDEYNNVNVTNLALSGRSSRSFLSETNYTTLCNSIGKGDYLFIQFGHNDEKTDESTYPGLGTYPNLDMSTLDSNGMNSSGQYSYEWILLNKYVKIAQNAGAVPILVTPITRRASSGLPYYSAHTDYQQAMIALGEQYNVAVIDMTALTTELYTNLYNSGGADATAALHCYSDEANTTIDNTHLSNYGATIVAGMIADQTKVLGLAIGNNLK